jgi:hypothetical protein
MFDKFKFSKGLKNAFKIGVDFFLGGGQGNVVDTVFDAGMDVERSKGGGFLDLVSFGAKKFVEMQTDKDGNVIQTPQFQAPKINRVGTGGGRAGRGGLTGQTRWTPANQMYRDAIIRRMKQVNFESNLQRMTESTTVRPTTRRKSPEKPGTTTITRTTKAKVIT